jgi:hypothetical protein
VKTLLAALLLITVGWVGLTEWRLASRSDRLGATKSGWLPESSKIAPSKLPNRKSTVAHGAAQVRPAYECGGRTRCPQMRSCDEAMWVMSNCPGTSMDGDNDGIPCEDQHCSSR